MSLESPRFEVQTQKVISTLPFEGLTQSELEADGFDFEVKSQLQKVAGLDVEHTLLLKPETGDEISDIFPTSFSYSRYVGKDGSLYYWRLNLTPQLQGESEQVLTDLVNGEPDSVSKGKMVKALKANLPTLTITPDKGAVMSIADTIVLQLGEEEYVKKNLSTGSEVVLKKPPVDMVDTKYYSEDIGANIESKVFDDDRSENKILDVLGQIKYPSIGMGEIIDKLQERMQLGLISESEVRAMINIYIDVFYTDVDRNDEEEVAA